MQLFKFSHEIQNFAYQAVAFMTRALSHGLDVSYVAPAYYLVRVATRTRALARPYLYKCASVHALTFPLKARKDTIPIKP